MYPCLVLFTRRGDAIANVVCPMLEGNVVVDYIGAAARPLIATCTEAQDSDWHSI